MSVSKLLLSIFIGLAVIFAQVGSVHAAPPRQDVVPITGTVLSVDVETNSESGEQTVVVTILVDSVTKTARLSVDAAVELGLIVVDEDGYPVVDENGDPVVDDSILGTDMDFDPATIVPDEEPTPPEEAQHPVGAKIADFFSSLFDVNYNTVMSSRSDGFGFGVIAQALWMTDKLGGDSTLFETILDAKKSGDYSLVALPDGSIPQSWGQLKKTVLKGEDDNSLGDIMSGGSGNQTGNPGNGNGKPENPGNGKPENPGNSNSNVNGNGNGNQGNPANGNGNGNRPETPPGQTKDKNNNKDNNNGNGKNK